MGTIFNVTDKDILPKSGRQKKLWKQLNIIINSMSRLQVFSVLKSIWTGSACRGRYISILQ